MFPAHPIPEDKILLGRIRKAHGIQGEMVISCFSGQPENIRQYHELFVMDDTGRISVPLSVRSCRVQGKNAILSFKGINCRSQLKELLGTAVLVAGKDLAPLAKDQFYWCQYQGKKVITCAGQEIGTVEKLFSNGAQDILVIRAEQRAEEILVPITKDIVIDENNEQLTINPPPGLLEINSESETQL